MMKLPNDRNKRNHEAWIVGLLMIIVACITYWIAVQWAYRGIRATKPAKATWIYKSPFEKQKIKWKSLGGYKHAGSYYVMLQGTPWNKEAGL